jgi:hypothetical protein
MAALEVVALDTVTPQLRAPGTGDTYSAPRALALAPESLTGSAAMSSLAITQTWNTTGTPTALSVAVTDTASNASSLLADFKVGGVSKASIQKDGQVNGLYLYASGGIVYDGTTGFRSDSSGLVIGSGRYFGFRSGATSGSADTILYRDAANTLALRNSTNAQAFNVYNTYTDASNYERAAIKWNSNVLEIGPEKAGTGSNRGTKIKSPGGNLKLEAGTAPWEVILSTAGHFGPSSPNNQDLQNWWNITQTGYHQFTEMTAPAAGAANTGRMYVEDNGAGKSRLMIVFASGAAQQIAIEP